MEAASAAFFLNLAVKSSILLAAAWLASRALRRRSAAARHLIWMAAFTAALALPALSLALPALRLPVAAWLADAPALVFHSNATAAPGGAAAAPPAAAAAAGSPTRAGFQIDWTLCLMLLWAGGSAALLGQMTLAYLRMARNRRRARPFGAAFDLPAGVAALEAPAGSMPMTFGVLRPVVFLPAEAREWSEERLHMVLRHELAHIERGDAATHLAARAAVSLLWWNPLAWMGWREFLKERERAADDRVLESGARASDYAGHLLEIARALHAGPATAWAAVAMARRSQLEGRLLSILDGGVNRKSARRASAVAAAAAAIALCAPFAAVRAQNPQALPPDVEATIRAAQAQKNYQMLDNAAAAFEKIQNYDTARKLLDAGLDIRASAAGEQSAEYAAGLVKLGDLEGKRSNKTEALRFYQKAVSLGDRPETAPALIELGVNSMEGKDMPGAMDFFERAARVSNSPGVTGRAYMWMAMAEWSNPDHAAQTEEDFRKATSLLAPNTSDSATALGLFARFLTKQGRESEAEPLAKQATATIQYLEKTGRADYSNATTPGVYHAGGDVSKPELIRKVEPQYTEEARAAKFQGVVVVSVVIEPDGAADNIRVVKSLGLGLDEKAIEAVEQWQFKPGMKNGVPVAVAATIEVNFRLL